VKSKIPVSPPRYKQPSFSKTSLPFHFGRCEEINVLEVLTNNPTPLEKGSFFPPPKKNAFV
jgi:hypothetical protein